MTKAREKYLKYKDELKVWLSMYFYLITQGIRQFGLYGIL